MEVERLGAELGWQRSCGRGLLAIEMFGSLGFVYERETQTLYVRVVLPRGAVVARACKPDLSTERSRRHRAKKKLGALTTR